MAKFDDILEEIKNLKKVEVPVSKKAEASTSPNKMNRDSDELNFGDYLIMFFGVLFTLCWITAFCDMIGLK